MALSTPKLQSKLMAHQNSQVKAGVTRLLDPNYPEPESKKEEEFEEDIDLETALTSL